MRIKEVKLKNFKRFTDLELKEIPESAKLVLLIGSNGSGKSSVFDEFEYISRAAKTRGRNNNQAYYSKGNALDHNVEVEFYGDAKEYSISSKASPSIALEDGCGRGME